MNRKVSNGYFGRFSGKPPGNYCVWCLTKVVVIPKGTPHIERMDEKCKLYDMGFIYRYCLSNQDDNGLEI